MIYGGIQLRPPDVVEAAKSARQRAAELALWRAGSLRFLLWDQPKSGDPERAQTYPYDRFRRGGAEVVVGLCSRQIGKSRYGVIEAAENAYRYPGINIPYAAKLQKQVKKFIEPHLRLLKRLAPEELAPYKYLGEWRFPPYRWANAEALVRAGVDRARFVKEDGPLACWDTGEYSTITIAGCETEADADSLRGPGTLFAVIDEAAFIPVLDYLIQDVIGPMFLAAAGRALEMGWLSTETRLLCLTTPPTEPDHPFIGILAQAEAAGNVWRANVHDAPFVTEEAIEKQARLNGGKTTISYQREVLGKIIFDPSTMCCPEYSVNESVIVGTIERPRWFDCYVVADLGFTTMTAFLFGYYHTELDLFVIEAELCFRGDTTDTMAPEVAKMERKLWGDKEPYRRRADGSPLELASLSKDSQRVKARKPDSFDLADPEEAEEAERAYWSLPQKDNLKAAVMEVRNRARVAGYRINPDCTHLRAHTKYAQWNKRRDKIVERTETSGLKHHFDAFMALVYFTRTVDVTHDPAPLLDPSITERDHYISPAAKGPSKTARALFDIE